MIETAAELRARLIPSDVAATDFVLVAWHDIDAMLTRLAAVEQLLGYCASPTMGWDASKGPNTEYVWVADEQLVRAALQAIILQAQRIREHVYGSDS